ncbi:AMP-binding protein [Streptomyces sp. NPDC007929]|uniref:AMP-dependent synthetase/ligase n=1 Tax=unclassified Streptomyces TaxID=2593676 RepID=UPI0036E40856
MNGSGLREVTTPAAFVPPRAGGLADLVFDRAGDRRGRVAVQAQEGGGLRDVDAGRFRQDVLSLAKGFLAAGVGLGDRVGVMSRPRYEWTVLDFALWSIGALPVPVPYGASTAQVEWILGRSGARGCVVEDVGQAMTVGPLTSRLRGLRDLWQLDTAAMRDLAEAGRGIDDDEVHRRRRSVMPDSPATVVHTAGTTGRPKGCLLSHGSLMTSAGNLLHVYAAVLRKGPANSTGILLHAPLEHLTARVTQIAAVSGGVPLAYQPPCSAPQLVDTLGIVRPGVLLAGPRAVEGLVAAFRETAEISGRVGSFGLAVDVAVQHAELNERRTRARRGAGFGVQHDLFEHGVYSAFRSSLGGRLRHVILCGSGVRRRLGLFMSGAGIDVHESYGLTEAGGPVTLGPPDRLRHGTAGRPLPGNSLYIDDDEQIWVHGAQNFAGYLGGHGHAVPAPGDWLATGDLGRLDADGHLTIVGRHGDTFVTAGGNRVVPLPLEEEIRSHPLVVHCVVVGRGRPHAAALITLDHEAVAHWLHVSGRPQVPVRRMPDDSALQSEINRAVLAANKKVPPQSAIRTFRLLTRQFTAGHGLVTSSLEPHRAEIEELFRADVEALYEV